MKIVVNKCYGGFGLSHEAEKYYLNLIGKECFWYVVYGTYKSKDTKYKKVDPVDERGVSTYTSMHDLGEIINGEILFNDDNYWYYGDLKRDDVNLVKTVEDLGSKANSWAADLRVIEIPDGVNWELDEYNGVESIHEVHRSW